MNKKLTLLSVLLLLCVSPTFAIDVVGPTGLPGWNRGDDGSTYQKFDMSTPNANPQGADIDQNPFGAPEIERIGQWEWAPDVDGPGGGTVDAWHCMGDGTGEGSIGTLKLMIPNDPADRPLKKLVLQITTTSEPTSIQVDGFGPLSPYSVQEFDPGVADVQHPGSYQGQPWYTYVYGYEIEPNPHNEEIWIDFEYCSWIDQIDVDTICTVPEPTTIGLLSVGGLACLVRRRRKA